MGTGLEKRNNKEMNRMLFEASGTGIVGNDVSICLVSINRSVLAEEGGLSRFRSISEEILRLGRREEEE